jgi:hypothetical protein
VDSGFSRILIAISLLLSLALLAGFSLLSNESAMLKVLTPVESDARQRELLLAAGAGKVASVRSLLAQGVRPEPETLAAAAAGAFEPIYSSSGCDRRAQVTQLLLDANPKLRLGHDRRREVLKNVVWIRGCGDVYRLIAN